MNTLISVVIVVAAIGFASGGEAYARTHSDSALRAGEQHARSTRHSAGPRQTQFASSDLTTSNMTFCTPRDLNDRVLPFSPTEATLKCEMIRLWRQDCSEYRSSGMFSPLRAYCGPLRLS